MAAIIKNMLMVAVIVVMTAVETGDGFIAIEPIIEPVVVAYGGQVWMRDEDPGWRR